MEIRRPLHCRGSTLGSLRAGPQSRLIRETFRGKGTPTTHSRHYVSEPDPPWYPPSRCSIGGVPRGLAVPAAPPLLGGASPRFFSSGGAIYDHCSTFRGVLTGSPLPDRSPFAPGSRPRANRGAPCQGVPPRNPLSDCFSRVPQTLDFNNLLSCFFLIIRPSEV